MSTTIQRNRTGTFRIAVTNEDGTPRDITGKTLELVAAVYAGAPRLLEKDSNPGGGITIDAGTGGTATLEFFPGDTANLPEAQSQTLLYDLVLIDESRRYPLITQATLTISGDVAL